MALLQQVVTKRKHKRLLPSIGLIWHMTWSHKRLLSPLLFDSYVFDTAQADAIKLRCTGLRLSVDRLKSEDNDAPHGSVVCLRCISRIERLLLGKPEFSLISYPPSRA